MADDTVILHCPAGLKEIEMVAARGYYSWPARLPGQPVFYPIIKKENAREITMHWNLPASGVDYGTRFLVKKELRIVMRFTASMTPPRRMVDSAGNWSSTTILWD
jgi:hypothetical protein